MSKIKYSKWQKELLTQVNNKSIYLWGAQGETLSQLTDSYIEKRERTSSTNAATVRNNIARVKKLRDARKKDHPDLKAFDCSGLGVYILMKHKVISSDMNANGLMGKCQKITKSDLKPGDFVFRVSSSGAYHIGYVIDDKKIVHSKGRDCGVVKETLDQNGSSYWNAFGRPINYIEMDSSSSTTKSANKTTSTASKSFTRELKKTFPIMKGDDVTSLQTLLSSAGYAPGKIDGQFGDNTEAAVKKFQKAKGLTIDGIAGKNTITKLGGKWM